MILFDFEFWLSVVVVVTSFFIGYYCAKEEDNARPVIVMPCFAIIAAIEVFRFLYL